MASFIIDTLGNDRHIVETLLKIKQHDEALTVINTTAWENMPQADLEMMKEAVETQRKFYLDDMRYAIIRRKELLAMKKASEKPLN